MKFIDIFVEVLKNFGDFKTRSNRAEFWIFVLVNFIISILIGMFSSTLNFIFSLVVLVPSLAVGARRMHDIGKSGWTQLWVLLPIIGWIYIIILYAKEGETSANKWGEVPETTEL